MIIFDYTFVFILMKSADHSLLIEAGGQLIVSGYDLACMRGNQRTDLSREIRRLFHPVKAC
jgi:hypothetical protein